MSNEKLQNMFIEDAPQDVNNLGGVESLSDLVIKLQKLEDEIEQDEQRLKLKKQNADQISQIAIPEIMESLKMKTMKLADGSAIEVKEIYSATIPVDKIITICNATQAFTKRYSDLSHSLKHAKQALPGFIEREMTEEELDRAASNYENDIDKDDIKEFADLMKMPSKKLH